MNALRALFRRAVDDADEAEAIQDQATEAKNAYIARRWPELAREYVRDPARQLDALDDLNFARIPQLGALLASGDDVEAMARIRARMTEYLADRAADAAEAEAYERYPEAI
jgi:hypothetical protein